MADPDGQHDEAVVVNLVDDPIVTDPNPIRAVLPLEGDTPGGRGSSASRSIAARIRCCTRRGS